MARYLSDDWFAQLNAAASAGGVHGATAGEHLVVQHEITGGPDGDITFHVVIDGGDVTFAAGPAPSPTVTFTQPYETAAAIGRGELSAQRAFMVGQLRVAGDLPALVEHHDVLVGVDDVFAGVRASTDW